MTELTMPKLSDSMEQGTILTWLKADGEQVQAGEDLLEIETDKATVTHHARSERGRCRSSRRKARRSRSVRRSPASERRRRPRRHRTVGRSRRQPRTSCPRQADSATAADRAASVAARAGASCEVERAPCVRATPLARRVAKAHGVSLDGGPRIRPARPRHPRRRTGQGRHRDEPRHRRLARADDTGGRAAQARRPPVVRQGHGRSGRAEPPAGTDRPADGRGEGDHPALPGADRGRDGCR